MSIRKVKRTREMDKLEALRMAIKAGEKSGCADCDVFEEAFNYIHLLAADAAKKEN